MTKSQMLSEVQDIFRDVLDNEDIVLAYETYSDDIDEWDSLTHIQLVVAIEKHFHKPLKKGSRNRHAQEPNILRISEPDTTYSGGAWTANLLF